MKLPPSRKLPRLAVLLALLAVLFYLRPGHQDRPTPFGDPEQIEEAPAGTGDGESRDAVPASAVQASIGKREAPVIGSKLGEPPNSGWVQGRIGDFFKEAEIIDVESYRVGERVEDRKTLVEVAGSRPQRILIEERLRHASDQDADLLSSHASMASSVVIGLANDTVGGADRPGDRSTSSAVTAAAAQAKSIGHEAYQKSAYSPVVVEFSSADSIDGILFDRESVQAMNDIRYVEPNYIYTTQMEPNDPSYADGSLWGMHNSGQSGGVSDVDINAPEAWATRISAEDVVVAVIDTGVFYTHEDLKDNMWINPGEIAGNGIDDDENGFVDDVHGINAITMSGDPLDDHSHGTHCAGTIGGQGDNGVGIAGVAWDVQIMGCKFLSSGGWGTLEDAVTAVKYATDMGAQVSSNSWGGGGFSQTLFEAFRSAEDAGVINVAAAGNSLNDNDLVPAYPASYELPGMVAVSAVDRAGRLAWFSSFGRNSVDVAAPGVDVLSSINEETGYALYSGTSMACPHVSGALAILLTHFPEEDSYRIINRVVSGAKPLDSLADRVLAAGMLDLANSINTASFPFKPIFTSSLQDADFILGDEIVLDAEAIGDEPLSYQWYRDDEAIEGATSSQFRIESGASEDQGVYRVVAQNPAGERSDSASAFAYVATDVPADATVSRNNIRWAVQDLSGSKQWYLQDELVPQYASTGFAMQAGRVDDAERTGLLAVVNGPSTLSFYWRADCDPSGRDGLSLYLDGVKRFGVKSYLYGPTSWMHRSVDIPAGEHRVLFTYQKDDYLIAGNDTAWIADMNHYSSSGGESELETDEDGVKIASRVQRQVVEGSRVLLNVAFFIYSSDLLGWKKDGEPLEHDQSSLYLPSAKIEDGGSYELLYQAQVWNGEEWVYEERKVKFGLEVVSRAIALQSPRIVSQPVSVESRGSRLTISVKVESLLPLSYQWSYGSEVIPEAVSATLEIDDFAPEREGLYSLTAENEAGSVSTGGIQASFAPERGGNIMIVDQPRVVVAEQGEAAVIPVEVFGSGPISYRWYRENVPLDGQITNALRLDNASSVLHNGSYSLEASNAYGTVRSWPIQLSITSPNGLAEAVDRPDEKWYSVGGTPWVLDSKVSTDQEDSAFILGTNLGISETSRLETEVFGPATIEFSWNTQGGQYFDVWLTVDGQHTGVGKFGSTGWDRETYELSQPGLHTVAWEFQSRSSTFGGAPQEHMLAWVDQVEISRPEPIAFLPPEIQYTLGEELVYSLNLRGYKDVELEGIPDWLQLDKRTLSLRGVATDSNNHWLKLRMMGSDGTEDHAWIKLASAQTAESEHWDAISGGVSGGGSAAGHFAIGQRTFVVSPSGYVRSSENGVDWDFSFIPLQYSYESLWLVERVGDTVYAFSHYGTYQSSNGRDWKRSGSAVNDTPRSGNLTKVAGGMFGLYYGGLVYTEDLAAWSLIPSDSGAPAIGRLYDMGGTIYGLSSWGTELYRYEIDANGWELVRSFANSTTPALLDDRLYWTEADPDSSAYRLVRSSDPESEEVELVAELSNRYSNVALSDERFFLWSSEHYANGRLDGTELEETESKELWSLSGSAVKAAIVGDLTLVYQDNILKEIDADGVSEIAKDGLDRIGGVAISGDRVLFNQGWGSSVLLSEDGASFQKAETSASLGTIVPKSEGFLGQLGESIYTSDDGLSWTLLSTLPDSDGSIGTLVYSNTVYHSQSYLDGGYELMLSFDGEEWARSSWEGDYVYTASVGAHAGEFLRLFYGPSEDGAMGYQLHASSDGVTWRSLLSETSYVRLVKLEGDANVYLIGNGFYLRSADLNTWERVEDASINPNMESYGRHLYLKEGRQVTLFNDDFERTFTLSLPIDATFVALRDDALYAGNYDGDAVRMLVPSASSLGTGPSNGRPGRISDAVYFYVRDDRVPENAFGGHSFGVLGLENSALSGALSFELVEGAGGEANHRFEIREGELLSLESYDHEIDPQLSIRLRATDSLGANFEGPMIIEVADVNEPPTDLRLTSQVYPETAPVGAQLASFYAVDPDSYESINYDLVAGEGDDHNAEFDIVNNAIVARRAFDVNEQTQFYLRARATDSAGQLVERKFTLTIVREDALSDEAFELWIRNAFGDAGVGLELLEEDSDSDGMINLLEYYLDTNPLMEDGVAIIETLLSPVDAGLDLMLYARANNPAIVWECQVSEDLANWRAVPIEFDEGKWSIGYEGAQIVEAVNVKLGLWRLCIRLPDAEQARAYRAKLVYRTE